ncbi:putative membrane protein [Phaeobacter piscinae]|uniref:Membrane protein n=1 Tax=Phaeobacter piscinae TaxID=1580596 RepID=A0AAN1LAY8_9RHOB|nr:bestrophin family protein [Phaeobacter piscinae]ATG44041.1 putative membrane protein [Phaeobacter piscinae]AUR36351.1 putative membrane protein [Phaeobacter piscinae]
MILRDKPGLMQLLFAVRGSVLPRILPRILGLSALSALVLWIDANVLPLPHTNAAPFAVFGIALSLFLGFRNNAAYDRWWEGRRLWGQLVADLRSLSREVDLFVADPDKRARILRLALGFLHLHRINLRKETDTSPAIRWTGDDFSGSPHAPCAALDALAAAVAIGADDGFARKALAERTASIALAQAGCERIATTPLPYVYSLLVFRTTYLYCLLLPFALIDGAGWLTPIFVGIVAYVFFGLAEVTEELSHPFGETVNGLPLDAICRTVERALAPKLGQDAPPPLQPVDYYLS